MWDSESSWPGSSCGCSERMGGGGGSDSSTVKEEISVHLLKKKKKNPLSQTVCKCILTHLPMWITSDTDKL